MELELSGEPPAELGRERQRIERMREDVRQEIEADPQRDAGSPPGRLAGVQNLRDEINLRRQPGAH